MTITITLIPKKVTTISNLTHRNFINPSSDCLHPARCDCPVTRLGEFDVRTKRVTSLSVEADSLIITSQSDTQLASQSVSQSAWVSVSLAVHLKNLGFLP